MDPRITSGATPDQIAEDLKALLDFRDEGVSLDVLDRLLRDRLVPHFVHYDDPGFHSLYNFLLDEGAALGARIALEHNQGVTNWQVSPGGVMLEELLCRALCHLFHLDPTADATFMYSGTYANHQALYMAPHRKAERQGLLPEYGDYFKGCHRADSVSWDPHKQLGVPIPSSILFCRHRADFERMAVYSDYYNREGESVPNPGIKSAPSTRPLSALPLVSTMRHLGLEGIRRRLRRPLEAIRSLADELADEDDINVLHTPDLGILCLRIEPPGVPEAKLDTLQQYLYERTMEEAKRSISMTQVGDKTALRFLALSTTVTTESMMATIQYLRHLATEWSE
jgi:glutamate/tyrosine decarboxylase-like PLP-dependent enzyme